MFPIAHRRKYGANVYTSYREKISFDNINNLFHPSTIDACYAHDGHGVCGGIKDGNGDWNLKGHRSRIMHYNDEYIKLLSDTFEDGQASDSAKLVNVHNARILSVLSKLTNHSSKVISRKPLITECWHETGAPKAGIIKDIKSHTITPNFENSEMIYNAPHFYVSNPLYQTPKISSPNKGDFTFVDLTAIEEANVKQGTSDEQVEIDVVTDITKETSI